MLAIATALLAWAFWGRITLGLDFQGGTRLQVAPKSAAERDAAVEQVRRVLDRERIEDANVHHQGDEIVIQLSGAGAERAAALEDLLRPSTLELLAVRDDGPDRSTPVRPEMLVAPPIATGADVRDVSVDASMPGERPRVLLRFSPEAGARFEQYTVEHRGERVAVVVDGEVLMAPVIQERIAGGVISIAMGANDAADAAERLATRLRSAGVALEVTSRITIDAAVGETWGLPVLRAWAGLALVAALVAALRPSRVAIACVLASLGPLLGLASLLTGMAGTFTSMAYVGAPCAMPPAIVIVTRGLRAEATSLSERIARAWPGWLLAAATFGVSLLVFAISRGPTRGASSVAAAAALAVAALAFPALHALPRRT
jgi:preprotein translocase subunit SecD